MDYFILSGLVAGCLIVILIPLWWKKVTTLDLLVLGMPMFVGLGISLVPLYLGITEIGAYPTLPGVFWALLVVLYIIRFRPKRQDSAVPEKGVLREVINGFVLTSVAMLLGGLLGYWIAGWRGVAPALPISSIVLIPYIVLARRW